MKKHTPSTSDVIHRIELCKGQEGYYVLVDGEHLASCFPKDDPDDYYRWIIHHYGDDPPKWTPTGHGRIRAIKLMMNWASGMIVSLFREEDRAERDAYVEREKKKRQEERKRLGLDP